CHPFSFLVLLFYSLFLFTPPAPTEFYTLSLHDALPILGDDEIGAAVGRTVRNHRRRRELRPAAGQADRQFEVISHENREIGLRQDRKSTRLNSSHVSISYAVFCLKKKKKKKNIS